MRSFSLSDLPPMKMLLHYFPIGLRLLIIFEQVLFDVHRIWIIVASDFMFDAGWVYQMVDLNMIGLFLHTLSICMVPLLVINPTV